MNYRNVAYIGIVISIFITFNNSEANFFKEIKKGVKKVTRETINWIKRPEIKIKSNGKTLVSIKTGKPVLRAVQLGCIYASGGNVAACAPDVIEKNTAAAIRKTGSEDLLTIASVGCQYYNAAAAKGGDGKASELCRDADNLLNQIESMQKTDQTRVGENEIYQNQTEGKRKLSLGGLVSECKCSKPPGVFGDTIAEPICESGFSTFAPCNEICSGTNNYSWTKICIADDLKFPGGAVANACACEGLNLNDIKQTSAGPVVMHQKCASGSAFLIGCDGSCGHYANDGKFVKTGSQLSAICTSSDNDAQHF